jgi:uncharacterized membrane protein YuzA (DUF378 family)
MKILCTPTIILIQERFYGISTDNRTKISLLPVCFGIFVTVVTDMEVNLVGTIFAILATISNTLYTIVGFNFVIFESGEKQKCQNLMRIQCKFYYTKVQRQLLFCCSSFLHLIVFHF